MQVGVPTTHFPISLTDGTIQQKLLEGNAVRDMKFDVSQWARLRLPTNVTNASGYWEGAVKREGRTWLVNASIGLTSASIDFVDLNITDVAFPLFVDIHPSSEFQTREWMHSTSALLTQGVVQD